MYLIFSKSLGHMIVTVLGARQNKLTTGNTSKIYPSTYCENNLVFNFYWIKYSHFPLVYTTKM